MTTAVATRQRLRQRGRLLAGATIAWNAVEGVVAIAAGISAGSLALVGFGLDSFVEVFAGAVVLWHLGATSNDREDPARRLIAVSFFALAAYVVAEAARDLFVGHEAVESTAGIALAAVSLAVMPALAWAKRRTGQALGDTVIVADSTETALCSYLSAILLAGLALNATLGWWWADPLAALAIAALALHEGRATWRGDPCCDTC